MSTQRRPVWQRLSARVPSHVRDGVGLIALFAAAWAGWIWYSHIPAEERRAADYEFQTQAVNALRADNYRMAAECRAQAMEGGLTQEQLRECHGTVQNIAASNIKVAQDHRQAADRLVAQFCPGERWCPPTPLPGRDLFAPE